MIALSWKVNELDDLWEKGRKLHSDVNNLLNGRGNESNVPSCLWTIRQKAADLVKGVVCHQQNAATYI